MDVRGNNRFDTSRLHALVVGSMFSGAWKYKKIFNTKIFDVFVYVMDNLKRCQFPSYCFLNNKTVQENSFSFNKYTWVSSAVTGRIITSKMCLILLHFLQSQLAIYWVFLEMKWFTAITLSMARKRTKLTAAFSKFSLTNKAIKYRTSTARVRKAGDTTVFPSMNMALLSLKGFFTEFADLGHIPIA